VFWFACYSKQQHHCCVIVHACHSQQHRRRFIAPPSASELAVSLSTQPTDSTVSPRCRLQPFSMLEKLERSIAMCYNLLQYFYYNRQQHSLGALLQSRRLDQCT
jgi:hypothetical protein